MSKYSGPERRRDPRVPVRMILESEVASRGEKARIETINMSAGGFLCLVDRPWDELTLLKLRIRFPSFGGKLQTPPDIDCTAVVVRCEPSRRDRDESGTPRYEVAASFAWIRPEDRRCLAQYLHWYQAVRLQHAFLSNVAREAS